MGELARELGRWVGRGREVRSDTEHLRVAVTIAAALRADGYDVRGDKGRCRCPVHGGDNPASFAYDTTRWHCFACGAGGDVFGLVMALRSCAFREAVAVVAGLAGVPLRAVPRIDRAEIARRQGLARRRAALDCWHRERIRQWSTLVGDLTREAAALGAYFGTAERRDDPRRWGVLMSVHWDLLRAEAMVAALTTRDGAEIAGLWLAERRGELLAPGDLS